MLKIQQQIPSSSYHNLAFAKDHDETVFGDVFLRFVITFIFLISLLPAEEKIIVVKLGESISDALAKKPDIVRLEPGIHRLAKTLVLNQKDSGITIEATGEKPTFIVGSQPIPSKNWSQVPNLDGIWKTIVPANFPEIRSVFFDGKSLTRARSKGYRQLAKPTAAPAGHLRHAIDEKHVYLPPALLEDIGDIKSGDLRVIPKYPWVCHILPISSLNRESGLAWSNVPGTYPMTPPAFGHFPEGTLWIENTLDVINEPGEWAFDRSDRTLYLKTPDGKPPGLRVEIPLLTELIRIEGNPNESDFVDHPARGITIRGITFARANAFGWKRNKQGRGLQHDWEMHDEAAAMVRLRYAEACRIENCRFVNAGATGLRMDFHCRKNVVQQCEFSALGGAGIVLAGYGMGYKDVNRENLIADNNIHHIGEYWWHSPGIFAWQSGRNRIIHNHIHHVPHNAITVSGRTQLSVSGTKESSKTARMDEVILHLEGRDRSWHSREPLMHGRFNNIGWNDIHHAMELMADGNAIYVSGTGTGNRIHHNFIHDIVSANMNGTIRIDDDQHEVTIDHNLITRCAGEGILWKGRCDILNNIIYGLRTKTPDGTATQHQRGFLVIGGPVENSVVKHNLFVSTHPRLPVLFEHEKQWIKHRAKQMPPMRLDQTNADFNLYWNTVNPLWASDFLAEQRSRGIEQNSISVDPHFANPKQNDFTIQQGTFDESIGFVRFDISTAGPRKTPPQYDPKLTDFSLENGELYLITLGEMSSSHPGIEWLNLYQTKIGDDGARIIGEMRSLTHLPAGETGITDVGLAHLSELKNLQYLGLRGNAISSKGLTAIQNLKSLKELNLAQTNVDDDGIAWLANRFDLDKLWLHDTRITDDSLAQLAKMKSLKTLYLQRTNTTADAIAILRKNLPNCSIFWESDER